MDNSKDSRIENNQSKTQWPLWLTAVLPFSSLVLCGISYFVPLYWLRISYNHFFVITVLSVVIVVIGVFGVIIPVAKKSIILTPVLRLALFVTLLLVSLNICITLYLGIFARNNHLDTIKFKDKVYHLVQDESPDVAYSYVLCECGAFGQFCKCNPIYSAWFHHDHKLNLGIDLKGETLLVRHDRGILYEYDGETGECYNTTFLSGSCLPE